MEKDKEMTIYRSIQKKTLIQINLYYATAQKMLMHYITQNPCSVESRKWLMRSLIQSRFDPWLQIESQLNV